MIGFETHLEWRIDREEQVYTVAVVTLGGEPVWETTTQGDERPEVILARFAVILRERLAPRSRR